MPTKKSRRPWLWLVASLVLGYASYYYFITREVEETPLIAAPPASAAVPPVATVSPRDWPYVRLLDLAQGTWDSDTGVILTIDGGRKSRKKDWTINLTGKLTDGGPPSTCQMSPELKDGGFHGTCDGEEFYIRLRMNQEKRLYAECVFFELTFKRRE